LRAPPALRGTDVSENPIHQQVEIALYVEGISMPFNPFNRVKWAKRSKPSKTSLGRVAANSQRRKP
jgi:hypothetical protein